MHTCPACPSCRVSGASSLGSLPARSPRPRLHLCAAACCRAAAHVPSNLRPYRSHATALWGLLAGLAAPPWSPRGRLAEAAAAPASARSWYPRPSPSLCRQQRCRGAAAVQVLRPPPVPRVPPPPPLWPTATPPNPSTATLPETPSGPHHPLTLHACRRRFSLPGCRRRRSLQPRSCRRTHRSSPAGCPRCSWKAMLLRSWTARRLRSWTAPSQGLRAPQGRPPPPHPACLTSPTTSAGVLGGLATARGTLLAPPS
jgi:hypothetical protein